MGKWVGGWLRVGVDGRRAHSLSPPPPPFSPSLSEELELELLLLLLDDSFFFRFPPFFCTRGRGETDSAGGSSFSGARRLRAETRKERR